MNIGLPVWVLTDIKEANKAHKERSSMDPRKKKEESLKHDRRNTYGENDKSSRKSIRRRKQWVNKSYRRRVNQTLATSDAEAAEDNVSEIRRPCWKKKADQPLGEVLLSDLIREIKMLVYQKSPESDLFTRLEKLMEENGWEEPGIRVVVRQLMSVALSPWSCELDLDLPTARKLLILLEESTSENAYSSET